MLEHYRIFQCTLELLARAWWPSLSVQRQEIKDGPEAVKSQARDAQVKQAITHGTDLKTKQIKIFNRGRQSI